MKAIGVDLGGHKIIAGLVTDGVVEARLEERTNPTRKPDPVIAQIARMARELSGGEDDKIPVGVCIPGGLDAAREHAVMITNFVGWNGLPIRRMLEGVVGGCVAIENDANAYALGEGFAGAAKGVDDYVMLTLGTGIGGGVVTGGRLLTGAHGMAGELGHMVLGRDEPCGPGCRGLGHFEALCGADALERKAKEMGLGGGVGVEVEEISLKDLWTRRGEPDAALFWDAALENMARGVASLVHIFDPERVVVGGGLRKGEHFMELLGERVPKYLGEPFRPTFKLCPSLLDTDAPIFGGAARALDRLQAASGSE
jgi:glucokinase